MEGNKAVVRSTVNKKDPALVKMFIYMAVGMVIFFFIAFIVVVFNKIRQKRQALRYNLGEPREADPEKLNNVVI